MMKRHLLIPAGVVLGLSGVGLYFAPCMMGDFDKSSVADSDEADTPCNKDKGAHEALAAEDEEPCPHAEQAKALAATDADAEEDPCPFAAKAEAEAQLAAQAKEAEAEAVAAAEPAEGDPQT